MKHKKDADQEAESCEDRQPQSHSKQDSFSRVKYPFKAPGYSQPKGTRDKQQENKFQKVYGDCASEKEFHTIIKDILIKKSNDWSSLRRGEYRD